MAFASRRVLVRPLLVSAALASASVLLPTLAGATPHPKPSVTSVQKQLGELALKNTQLVEQYDQARVAVGARQRQLTAARQAAVAATARYASARQQFVQIVQGQYETQDMGSTTALLMSDSGANYIDRLDTLTLVSAHTAQVVKTVSAAEKSARTAAQKARTALAAATAQRDALAAKRATVVKQIAKYRTLLASLKSAQRAAYLRAANPAVPGHAVANIKAGLARPNRHVTAAGSGAARVAVQFALNQVGKPYVWGAAGPGSYDCSGLTMAAWHAAGVSLPHSAAQQYNYGHHVPLSDLQPGDLVFMYQPIGHVTIYIGGGMLVSAPEPGENVSVVPLAAFLRDTVGATRLT